MSYRSYLVLLLVQLSALLSGCACIEITGIEEGGVVGVAPNGIVGAAPNGIVGVASNGIKGVDVQPGSVTGVEEGGVTGTATATAINNGDFANPEGTIIADSNTMDLTENGDGETISPTVDGVEEEEAPPPLRND